MTTARLQNDYSRLQDDYSRLLDDYSTVRACFEPPGPTNGYDTGRTYFELPVPTDDYSTTTGLQDDYSTDYSTVRTCPRPPSHIGQYGTARACFELSVPTDNYSTTTARLRDDYNTTTADCRTAIARSGHVRGRLATSDDYVNTARSGRASSLPDDYHTVSWTPDDYGTARACSGPARRLPHSQLDPGRLRHGQGVLGACLTTTTRSTGTRTTTARSGRALCSPDDYRTVNWTPDDYGTVRACSMFA